jgi:hypothetical protein
MTGGKNLGSNSFSCIVLSSREEKYERGKGRERERASY